MENFNIESGSDSLSEKQIKFVCDVLEKQGFKGSKVNIGPLGTAGDNYSSNVKRITAQRDDGNIFKMVAKVAPTVEILRTAFSVEVSFGNECLMYDKVLPKFRQLEIEAGIPEEDRLQFAICYGTLYEKPHEMILLEDARDRNFIMSDRLKSLTDEEVKLVLKSYAKLHALSFALKGREPATYSGFTSILVDYFTTPAMCHNALTTFGEFEKNVTYLLDNDKYKKLIKGTFTTITDEASKLLKHDSGSKYSVIIHGDSWINNVLFKLENGAAQKCMFIDYQMSVEKSPVSDLHYFIFNCTDFDMRSKHYNNWIDLYHDELDKRLSYFGYKVNNMYPKERLLADLKRYAKFFLSWSIIITNIINLSAEESAKLKNVIDGIDSLDLPIEGLNIDDKDSSSKNAVKEKIQGIIESFIEFGYCSRIDTVKDIFSN